MILLRSIHSANQVTVPLFPSGIRTCMDTAAELSKEETIFQRHIASSAYAAAAVALSACALVSHVGLGVYHFTIELLTFHPIAALIALGESLLFTAQALLFITVAVTAIALGLLFPGTIYPLFSTTPDPTPYPDEAIAGECELPSPFKNHSLEPSTLVLSESGEEFGDLDYLAAWRQQLAQEGEYTRQKAGLRPRKENQIVPPQDIRIQFPQWLDRQLADRAQVERLKTFFISVLNRSLRSEDVPEGVLSRLPSNLLWEGLYPIEITAANGSKEKATLRVGFTMPNGRPPELLFEILGSAK